MSADYFYRLATAVRGPAFGAYGRVWTVTEFPRGVRQVIPPPVGLGCRCTRVGGCCLLLWGSGAFAGSVAGSVHEDLMAGVDESVEE